MAENEQMKQLADSLWEYFKPKMQNSQKNSISYFKAVVVSGASGGKIRVKKPFDSTVLSLPYAQSAAQLAAGAQCIVFQMGDMSNSIVVANGDLSNFGGGGGIQIGVSSVNGMTGDVVLGKSNLGLSNVDNVSVNRSTNVNAADTNYTTLMARGEKLLDAATFDAVSNWSTQLVNGGIAWRYE